RPRVALLEQLADEPLVLFRLPLVLAECVRDLLVAGEIRRVAKLGERLLLDRVRIGQILRQLLVDGPCHLLVLLSSSPDGYPGATAVEPRAADSPDLSSGVIAGRAGRVV